MPDDLRPVVTTSPPDAAEQPWLARFPIALFGAVPGTAGLAGAWRLAAEQHGWPSWPTAVLGLLAVKAFLVLTALLAVKLLRHPDVLREEFESPADFISFGIISVALIALSGLVLPWSEGLGRALWLAGGAIHLAIALIVVRRWITREQREELATPAWFIPVVGHILLPVTGLKLGYVELSWFAFSIGFCFWVPLFALLLHRLAFGPLLKPTQVPTLAILVGPPAVGCTALLALSGGEMSAAVQVLYGCALFLALLMATLGDRFFSIPVRTGWWSFTFPAAALATAALHVAPAVPASPWLATLALGLLLMASAVFALVAVRTGAALAAGTLFDPE